MTFNPTFYADPIERDEERRDRKGAEAADFPCVPIVRQTGSDRPDFPTFLIARMPRESQALKHSRGWNDAAGRDSRRDGTLLP